VQDFPEVNHHPAAERVLQVLQDSVLKQSVLAFISAVPPTIDCRIMHLRGAKSLKDASFLFPSSELSHPLTAAPGAKYKATLTPSFQGNILSHQITLKSPSHQLQP